LINVMALMMNHKSCHTAHNLVRNINTAVGLPLAQLFSVHSVWMHMVHNALYCRSHTELRNWWLRLVGTYENCVPSLVKNTRVTLYIYCIHCATQ
jgi:hypothetical protein